MEINGTWKSISQLLISKWKDEKQRSKLLLVIGLTGLLLITLSGMKADSRAGEEKFSFINQTEENEVYIQTMETKLSQLVENISGAGKCHVMVTLEQGIEYVYASENKKTLDETQSKEGEVNSKIQQKDNRESHIVVLEENGVSRPLVETSREPKVQGVVVVCEGGNSSAVKQRITEVLTTVLGIGSDRVCVVPRK